VPWLGRDGCSVSASRPRSRHPDRPRLIEWIRGNGGDMWDKYLDKIAPASAAEDGADNA
jgi:hypothetical protein